MSRTRQFGLALVAALLLAAPLIPALAQDIGAKLSAARMGDIEPGQYQAGDRVNFILAPSGDRFFLKYADSGESFVLTSERTSLGGRVLRYDTGNTVIQVSGLGSLTLYPDAAPNGLPAARTGEAPKFSYETVSLTQMQAAAQDIGHRLNIVIVADWTGLAADPGARSIGLEALQNFDQGAQRFIKQRGQAAFAQHVDTVQLAPGIGPTILAGGKRLMLGYRPDQGYSGRQSSRAVAQTLNSVLAK